MRPRPGITLLEVLISIFVLAIGLLGLASLIPVARFHMVEAAKLDRSSALARSALHDIEVRGLLRPDRWLLAVGGPVLAGGVLAVPPPFAIDPRAVMYPGNVTKPGEFPTSTLSPSPPLPIPRLTFNVAPGSLTAMPYALIERLCVAEDDLLYALPDNAEHRPFPGGGWTVGSDGAWGVAGTDDDGNGTTDDSPEAGWPGADGVYGTADDSDDRLHRNYAGDYSWLITVSPSLGELAVDAATMRSYALSLVVFQQRNLLTPPNTPANETPAERMVYCDFPAGATGVAYGGGSVILRTSTGGGATAEWLDMKPGQWIMLSAAFVTDPTTSPPTQNNRLAWYRIAGVDEFDPTTAAAGPWQRNVTLAGPDWPAQQTPAGATIYIDADTSNTEPTVYATIFDGAIAVHEQTIMLDGRSLWAP